MLTGKVIGTAKAVYDHCCEVLSHGIRVNAKEKYVSLRQFVFVAKDEVDRANIPEAKTLAGTRQIHAIRNTDTDYIVESRLLSCYCNGCRTGVQCQNQVWTMSNLQGILTDSLLFIMFKSI